MPPARRRPQSAPLRLRAAVDTARGTAWASPPPVRPATSRSPKKAPVAAASSSSSSSSKPKKKRLSKAQRRRRDHDIKMLQAYGIPPSQMDDFLAMRPPKPAPPAPPRAKAPPSSAGAVNFNARYRALVKKIAEELRVQQEELAEQKRQEEELRAEVRKASGFQKVPARWMLPPPAHKLSDPPRRAQAAPAMMDPPPNVAEINAAILRRQQSVLQSLVEQRECDQGERQAEVERLERMQERARALVMSQLTIEEKRDFLAALEEQFELRNVPYQEDPLHWKRRNQISADTRVFAVSGAYGEVRRALSARGWVENTDAAQHVFDLKWTTYASEIPFASLRKDQIVNHFESVDALTTKLGLCRALRDLPWCDSADPARFYPRCYDLSDAHDLDEFIDDFRMTAAQTVLERLAGPDTAPPSDGHVSPYLLQIAVRACEVRLSMLLRQHDTDSDETEPLVSRTEWEHLMLPEGAATARAAAAAATATPPIDVSYWHERGQRILALMRRHNPQATVDGPAALWVVKASEASKGRGVTLHSDLGKILAGRSENARVVQKYIERPLLVRGFKFDLRQWILVTSWNPLVVWVYGRSYLRFASRRFALNDLGRAVHLCNYSVQRHQDKDPGCPGVWTDDQLEEHLEQPGLFARRIYPAIKASLRHTFACVRAHAKHRNNSFALYGADFVLDEDLRPWLIEVNESPGLRAVPDMVSSMLQGLVALVLDGDVAASSLSSAEDSTADLWHPLCQEQAAVTVPAARDLSFLCEGRRIRPAISK